MSLSVRQIRREDDGTVFDLLCETGMESAGDREAWLAFSDWAYWRNPYRGALAPGWVGEQGGQIVAYMGCIHMPFRLGDWRGVAGGTGALAVSPRATGLVGVGFTRAHLNDADVPVQFGAHFGDKSSALWLGFKGRACAGSELTYSGALSGAALMREKLHRRGGLGRLATRLGADRLLASLLLPRDTAVLRTTTPPSGGDLLAVSLTALEARGLDALCRDAQSAVNAGVVRDSAFLRWRYRDHPRADSFVVLALGALDRPEGLAILQRSELGTLRLCEFLVPAEARQSAERLLEGIVAWARGAGYARLVSKNVTTALQPLWQAAGFHEGQKPYPQYIVVAKGGIEMPERLEALNAYGDFKLN